MDVKEAVKTAKQYVNDLFAAEGIEYVGLEEVDFDDEKRVWEVTIGFSRTWKQGFTVAMKADGRGGRSFKIVRIHDISGRVVSLTHRTLPSAR